LRGRISPLIAARRELKAPNPIKRPMGLNEAEAMGVYKPSTKRAKKDGLRFEDMADRKAQVNKEKLWTL
jgi:hypothetical protein